MEYHIRQYGLQQGALEIQYIEEFFGEFSRRKTAAEVIARLSSRDHQIVMAEAALLDDQDTVARSRTRCPMSCAPVRPTQRWPTS